MAQEVVVEEHSATSVEGIQAAGDVAQAEGFSSGGYSAQALQPAAVERARLAASNRAGRASARPGSVNVHDTMGLVHSRTRPGACKERSLEDPVRRMEAHIARCQALGANAYVCA